MTGRAASERKQQQIKEELKQAKARYLDVFDNTSDLIQCLAADGAFHYTNRTWRKTLGYTKTEVKSLTLAVVLHPDSQ